MTLRGNTFLRNDADDGRRRGRHRLRGRAPTDNQDLTRGDASPIILSGNTFGAVDGEGETSDGNDADERAAPSTSTTRSARSSCRGQHVLPRTTPTTTAAGCTSAARQEIVLPDNVFRGQRGRGRRRRRQARRLLHRRDHRQRLHRQRDRRRREPGSRAAAWPFVEAGCFDEPDARRRRRRGSRRATTSSRATRSAATTARGGAAASSSAASRRVSTNDTFVGNEIDEPELRRGRRAGLRRAPARCRSRRANLVAAGNVVDPAPAEEAAPPRGAPIPQSVGGGLWLAGRQFPVPDRGLDDRGQHSPRWARVSAVASSRPRPAARQRRQPRARELDRVRQRRGRRRDRGLRRP